jgi:hypothetical protein
MDQVAQILRAIASLAWPGFAFTALFVFRRQLIRVLDRLDKLKIKTKDFELEADLSALKSSADATMKELPQLRPALETRIAGPEQEEAIEAIIKSTLQEATTAPKVALLTLRAELEKQAMQGLATRGMLRGRPVVPLVQALSELRQYGIPPSLEPSVRLLDEVSNTIIHGVAGTDADVLRALDSGIAILRTLNALPNEVNVVCHPGVDIFSDASCTKPIPDAKGVILESTSPGGVMMTLRIFPTTRTDFQKGKRVAWEWNIQRVWPAAWYRDPDTGAIKRAWEEAAEFIGRHLEEI